MTDDTVYAELGVPTVVNAAGTKTRIGGSRIRPEAREAMDRAAEEFVRLSDLQAAASDRIAEVTGAEAGYVTNGAAGALMLGAAACIAGTDPGVAARLPDTESVADEIVMPRTHRTGYDHALRTAGATIVDVGTNDATLGTGARNVEPWEYADAIGEDTAAVAHVYKSYEGPPLDEVCEIAHDHGVPVVVDAAAELPPVENLSWFTEQGADLVAFSGGKGIRGPQTTGILAGRADLIESVAAQHLDTHATESVWDPPERLLDADRFDGVPRQGVGRPLKVGKEELVGLLAALDAFLEEDHETTRGEWRDRADAVAAALAGVDGLSTTIEDGAKSVAPTVSVAVDAERAGASAAGLVLTLRREDPRVFVGADGVDEGTFAVSPMCLTDEEAEYVVERIRANLGVGDGGD
ncbi:aminotransferase class V-fold PLP-dependent enzyme [Halosimplex salinum]|uniref:aminotransferase class V-fold PLP-dependent enzyme n=1 Tax=Halosimplex salinum TaxID=1710538 RepID=UPI000F4AD6ED|nr:aminotransferase class V-fold PLP-dependent enzyme [Halosimplex salinum]